jgi:hypothetical protein
MLKQGLIISLLLTIVAAAPVIAAERYMYKWKSEDGEIHYTERPPKDIPYERIRVTIDERSTSNSKSNLITTKKDSGASTDIKKADDSYQAWRRENCKIAQQNLDILENAGRIAADDGQGGKRLMTDEEREANKKKAREAVAKYCDQDQQQGQ